MDSEHRSAVKDAAVLTQGVHLELLPQSDLLQAVVEVWLRVASGGGREGEDPHDLSLVPATQLGLRSCTKPRMYNNKA